MRCGWCRPPSGLQEIPVTVENVMHWQARADTAERFRSGRIFIAGDAARMMPPTGWMGRQSGGTGRAQPGVEARAGAERRRRSELLGTYEDERRPIGALTVEQAYTRYLLRTDPSIPRERCNHSSPT